LGREFSRRSNFYSTLSGGFDKKAVRATIYPYLENLCDETLLEIAHLRSIAYILDIWSDPGNRRGRM